MSTALLSALLVLLVCAVSTEASQKNHHQELELQSLGCFKDSRRRDLTKLAFSSNKLTLDSCYYKCLDLNYPYFGLQAGRECWCGKSFGRFGRAKSSECRRPCAGRTGQKCGGSWRNRIFATGLPISLGCFLDKTTKRDLSHRASSGYMTIEYCDWLCTDKKYRYFGLQGGTVCMCGKTFGRHGKRSASECKKRCDGDRYQICGGSMRNSVYRTSNPAVHHTSLGCFKDTKKRDLPVLASKKAMSVSKCFKLCIKKKYPYFGLQYGSECWCGKSFGRYGRVDNSQCGKKCNGDHHEVCGDSWRNSVYATGVHPKKMKYRHIGCYLDKSRRDLVLSLGKDNKLSVEKCGDQCKKKGYKYFGVQYASQCFCGNHYGRYGKRADKECSTKCKGDRSEYCGGTWRNDVYSTGLNVKKPYYLLGCYQDSSNRDLISNVRTGTMTHKICYDLCRARGKPYFGVQNRNACFCGNFYGRYGKRPLTECSYRCSGDKGQYCGGHYRNMVYRIRGLSVRRQVVSYLYPSVRTHWGSWGSWHHCPAGYYVNRFQLRVEGRQGRGDDTALNTVKMYCSRWPNHWEGHVIYSRGGYWGNWRSVRSCSGGFFNAIHVRSEPRQGRGDDTAANDVRMRCSNGHWYGGGGMSWGGWGSARYCPSGSAICAIRTQVERPQGRGDDTALNAVRAACCRL